MKKLTEEIDSSNPWQTLSSKPIYENNWIQVREDQVITPSNNPGIYGVVDMKNLAIGVLPIDKEGNTWLIGQYRYALEEYSWEIPTGGGAKGTDMLDSAKRELREEAGLIAQNWELLIKLHTSNSITTETAYIFLATDLSQTETEFDETEKLEIKKVTFKEALEAVMNGEITDAMSVAAILKYAKLKGL